MSRKVIDHQDAEARLEYVISVLEAFGYRVTHISYRDVLAFPLSGGLVGYELCPPIDSLQRLVLAGDEVANQILQRMGLQKHLCWRYLVHASKT